MTELGLTPSQTVGPFYAVGLPWPGGSEAVDPGRPDAIWVRGRVTDGAGAPVPDALIETWQPDSGHRGFTRVATDTEGHYALVTTKPAAQAGHGGSAQAPYLAMSVFARGLLDRVVTRVYFADEAAANAIDPVLAAVSDEARRTTLVATSTENGYTFDIRLQGEGETVFFAI